MRHTYLARLLMDGSLFSLLTASLSRNTRSASARPSAGPTITSGIIPWHAQYPIAMPDGMKIVVDLSDGHIDVLFSDLSSTRRRRFL